MKAWVFGGMLVLCGAVAACSSDSGDSSSSGTGGSGGSGSSSDSASSGSPTSSSGSPTSTGTTGATTSTTSTSSSPNTVSTTVTTATGTECTLTEFFGDPTCDTCLVNSCCAEAEACVNDQANCLNADATINPDSSVGGPLLACLDTNCSTECSGGGGICDSGLSIGDPDADACLGDACCDEFNACSNNGADTQACIDCFNAGGTDPLCAAAAECADGSGCLGAGGGGICDSGISVGDDTADACLGDACCDEFNACTQNGADPQGCIDCFNAGSGELCDAAIACADASGC